MKFNLPKKSNQLPDCTHDWELAARTYAPPIRKELPAISDAKVLEKALFGITTYLSECKVCGSTRKEEVLGSDENQLATLIDNVERSGMQYVKWENGNVYAIAKWVPEVETRVPVRNG